MAIDKGGGTRGEGGKLADSNDPTTDDPIVNREQFNYDIGTQTTDQSNISPLDLDESVASKETDQYIIIGVGPEFLFVNRYVSGEAQSEVLQVSIPFTLRKSFWDGKEINGWAYSFTSYGTRIRELVDFGAKIEEWLYPAYQVGDVITASESNTADGNTSLLVGSNDGGRSWIPYGPRLVLVEIVGHDTLTCSALEDSNVKFQVARPHTLRRKDWDQGPVQGISYVYDFNDPQKRVASQTGEDDEEQIVIPPYIEDQSQIIVAPINVFYLDGAEATPLYDVNNDARAWALAPA